MKTSIGKNGRRLKGPLPGYRISAAQESLIDRMAQTGATLRRVSELFREPWHCEKFNFKTSELNHYGRPQTPHWKSVTVYGLYQQGILKEAENDEEFVLAEGIKELWSER